MDDQDNIFYNSNSTIFFRAVLFTTPQQVEESQVIGFFLQFSKPQKTTFNATVQFYEPQTISIDINNTQTVPTQEPFGFYFWKVNRSQLSSLPVNTPLQVITAPGGDGLTSALPLMISDDLEQIKKGTCLLSNKDPKNASNWAKNCVTNVNARQITAVASYISFPEELSNETDLYIAYGCLSPLALGANPLCDYNMTFDKRKPRPPNIKTQPPVAAPPPFKEKEPWKLPYCSYFPLPALNIYQRKYFVFPLSTWNITTFPLVINLRMDILKKQNGLEMYIGKGTLPGLDNPRGQHEVPWTRPDNLITNELLYEQEEPDFLPSRGIIGDTIILNSPDDVDDYYVMILSYIGYSAPVNLTYCVAEPQPMTNGICDLHYGFPGRLEILRFTATEELLKGVNYSLKTLLSQKLMSNRTQYWFQRSIISHYKDLPPLAIHTPGDYYLHLVVDYRDPKKEPTPNQLGAIPYVISIESTKHRMSDPCSGNPRGECILDINASYPRSSSTHCECTPQYTGYLCELRCPSPFQKICSGIGNCTFDPKTNQPYCKCPPFTGGTGCEVACEPSFCNWNGRCNIDKFHNKSCSCHEGYRGANCDWNCPIVDGKICNDLGKCVLSRVENTAICECQDGWEGNYCAVPFVEPPSTDDHSLYYVIGGVSGGAGLLLVGSIIGYLYYRSKNKQSDPNERSQSFGAALQRQRTHV